MDALVKLFGIVLAIGLAGGTVYLVVSLIEVLIKRLEGRRPGSLDAVERELDELRMRIEDGEQARQRIAELEERLEFAERLLAQKRDHERLHG
jgi:hypothetical protein